MNILTCGEAMLLINRPGVTWNRMLASVAGAEANTAIGLARLGHAVTWASTVGDDPAGELIISTLRGEGVTVQASRESVPTGLILRCGRSLGEPSVHYYRRDSPFAVAPPNLDPTAYDLVYLSGITPALSSACRTTARSLATAATNVVFDLNFRRKLWSTTEAVPELRWFCGQADLVLATASEAALLIGEAPPEELGQRLLSLGCRAAVVRHGRAGASYTTAAGTVLVPELSNVIVTDPIGAGDAFAAGLISGICEGLEPAAQLARAHLCGAAVCQTEGDWEGALYRRDLTATSLDAVR
jgi:2-dehydro-3-deoxygluconokinase